MGGMQMTRFDRRFALALLIAIASLSPAVAAPPVDAPRGTVCVTAKGWCWAIKPGRPGAPCACQTANGWIQGLLK